MEEIRITTEYIKLQDLLKFASVASTGGEVCTMRGKKIRPGDDVLVNGLHYTVSYADQ